MATAYSEASGSQPYVYLEFTGTSHPDKMTYSWAFYYHASYAISTSSSKPVHAWIKGSAQSGWTTLDERNYSINGKTGNNLIASGSIDIPRTHSQQTVTGYVRIEFGGVVYSGVTLGTRNGTASVTIGAKTNYAVTYNANGGEGAPGNQTKWYGESLTLSSTVPTRANYTFTGWNTKADGTGTSYSPGQTYSSDQALALYAQWQIAMIAPRISAMQLYHSDSNGDPDDEGTYLTLIATVECAQSQGATEDTEYHVSLGGSTYGPWTIPAASSGVTGNVTRTWGGFQYDSAYTATLVATYEDGVTGDTVTASATATAAARFYTLDFKAGGKGISIGQRATADGLWLAMPTYAAGYSEPIADYPVHRGSDGIWEYVIYASGVVECWGKTSTITTAITSAWGSIYYAGPLGTANYPTNLFSSVSYTRADWIGENADTWSGEDNNDGTSVTAPPKVYAYSAVKVNSHTGHIRYYARGMVGSISY